MGMTELIFVDPQVKVSSQYCRDVLLSHHMLPVITQAIRLSFNIDDAPSHRVKDTIKLLQQETPDFIGSDLWPPNSRDLIPVDYKI